MPLNVHIFLNHIKFHTFPQSGEMASAYNLIIPFWKGFSMNAGYVRLSRDDDKRNYVSIENQKLIIRQYAETHGAVINRWY